MARNIAIKDEIYNELLLRKGNNKSFSDVIEQMLQTKGEILGFFGILSDLTPNEEKSMKEATEELKKMRKLDKKKANVG